jgi:hypothetical protein
MRKRAKPALVAAELSESPPKMKFFIAFLLLVDFDLTQNSGTIYRQRQ